MDKEGILSTPFSRRELLKLGVLAAAGLALQACGMPPRKPKTDTIESITQPEYKSEQARVIDIINTLPETSIKTLLNEKVVPILENPSETTTLTIAGIPVKIHGLEIIQKTHFINVVYGSFKPVGNPEKVESFFPTKEKSLQIPYLYLLKPEEKEHYPFNIARDGTIFFNVTFSTPNPLHEGIAPVITVATIHPSIRKPAFEDVNTFLENFTYIKEASALLVYFLIFEDTVKKMQELGFETHLEAVSTKGTHSRIEGINRSISLLGGLQYGRLHAAHDVASYLLAVKAFGDRFNLDYIDESEREFYEHMKNIPLPSDSSLLLKEAFQWVMSLNPKTIPIHYKGNLSIIP